MEKKKEYSKDDLTVVWKPEVCIHSGNCVGALPEVFKPKDKPWIQTDSASSDEIIAAIKKCPSGALSYHLKGENTEGSSSNSAEKTQVEIINNGPLMVHGAIQITHDDGSVEEKKRSTAFCRCGKSGNKPLCDGSHNN